MFRILFIFLALSQAKIITRSFSLKQLSTMDYIPISRFGSRGVVNYEIQSRLINVPKDYEGERLMIPFEFFQQDKWQQAQSIPECRKQDKANRIIYQSIEVNPFEEISTLNGQLAYGRHHNVWLAIFNNCDHKLEKMFSNSSSKIKLEITIWFYDEGGQEFSLEEHGLFSIVSVLALLTIIGFYYNYRIFRKEQEKYGEKDYALLFVLVIIGLEASQNTLNFFNLLVYNSNGRGISVFAILSEVIQSVDNYLLMLLLILIAWGWTIDFINLETQAAFYLPLVFVLGIVQTIFAIIGRLLSTQTQFHMYEGWAGYSISIIYIVLALYFFYSANQQKKKGEVADSFYFKLKLFGTLFFISFPVLLMVSKVIDPYKSYKVIILGSMLMRLLNIALLVRLFVGKSTDYQRICIKGKSFLDRDKIM
ncbi:unnamed protein product (macronuclear) [Paramecium tetraurelia]|uniref:GPR180/TMEM145 transmembrane domain-containing protein n=1 Tax=Paramecium tetraurelia TaxID=5888 RepID=A0CP50_PARTE|nr:uncharacterized protein GSPATT00008958001 [Paramecium tetraurelia]CAK72567.1 unnamed protein product [Paramecium tetraurelia]|eukprot:XP_001439964.1 hypothetical protein (macronuclear) [Paramecium tetraurelia strain d4-2]